MVITIIFQKGFNYSQDGPGNRLVYHLMGCNMACRWCSNPEGMKQNGGEYLTTDMIVEEAKRSRMMFFDHGGVTFTGGEPTMQFEELLEACQKLHKNQINTAIETNGTSDKLPQLIPYIDYLMMDFKHYDGVKLKEYTGVGNEQIKRNFETLCENEIKAHIRIPLIYEFNAEPQGFIEYFSKWDTKHLTFEILPYHEYGRDKWTQAYAIHDGYVPKEILEAFIKEFKNNHLTVIRT